MADPYFDIAFPGLTEYMTGNATVTLSHGARPSVFTIEVGEVYNYVRQVNRLSIRVDNREVVGFPRCALDGIYRGGDGGTATVRILDRRWMWWKGRGRINGSYNIRKPQLATNPDPHTIPQQLGVLEETKRTPQQLAVLCLQSLGETGFDVSQLPNKIDPRTAPEVVWDNIPPAQALEELVEKLGCRIVLGTDDRVRICRIGEGRDLPSIPFRSEQASIESAAIPDALMFIAGPTMWQGLMTLEAVGIETTGEIVPIDALSYTPSGGWRAWSPFNPETGVDRGKTIVDRNKARSLAQIAVWKWYRVCGQPSGELGPIPNYPGEVKHRWQYHIRNRVLDTRVSTDGSVSTMKPYVVGRWAQFQLATYEQTEVDKQGNVPPNSPFPEQFSIDEENGLVQFGRPLFLYTESGEVAPAKLFLYSAYQVKGAENRIPERMTFERQISRYPAGTGPLPFKVEDVYRTIVTQHKHVKDDQFEVEETNDNKDEMIAVANYYIAAKSVELMPPVGQDREYPGFVNISPDGAIQQVTWQLSAGVATTRGSINTEHSVIVPRYHQRQVSSQVQTINQKLHELERRNVL